MAPIFKDAETAVSTATSAPASSAPKSPADATRPQPVALEIPVTINGAHTVAGSDKREPFSETTQTVLVFAHGAVVRVSTSLAPGQLVFLTNEKTKKEVVCQVLKSKSGGSTNNYYVELQFTEPAPSFWGLRAPAGPAAPPAATTPKAVVPVAPAPPKPIAVTSKPAAPPSPLVSVPPPSPLPAAEPPRAQATPTAPAATSKPMVAPPPPSAVMPVSLSAATPPVAPVSRAPLVSVPPPSPFATAPEPPRVQAAPHPAPPVPQPVPAAEPPAASVTPAAPQNPPAGEKHASGIPVPPVHDYSKEIEALFSTPSSSTSHPSPAAPPEPKVAPPPCSTPSTDQLKLEAARLQAQLGSMLFTEPSAPSHAAPPPAPKPGLPAADVAKKVFEVAQEPLKGAAPEPKLPEPKLVPPPPPRKAVSLSADDEEVKIPSWLAPLSQKSPSSAVAEPPASVAAEPEAEVSELPQGSSSIHSVETPELQEMPIFSSQLTAEVTPQSETAEPSSKKSMWIGAAAAVLFVVASLGYFLRPMLSGTLPAGSSSNKPATVATNPPPAAAPTSAPAADSKPVAAAPDNANSTPVSSTPAPPSVSQPSRNPEPPAPAPPVEPKASTSRSAPTPEPKKSALGEVHLATPVVSHDASARRSGEPVPSIDASSNPTSDGDTLAAVASTHRAQPTAPLPVGGEVTPAQLLKSVPPVYPPVAKAQHITGNVALDCLIDAHGNVVEVKVLSGPPMLHRAASDAVKQWKYKPAILDGQPTSMHVTVTVQFRSQ